MTRPMLGNVDRSIAKIPDRVVDPFYHSADWKALRQAVFRRDGYGCSAPGCQRPAITVDHIVSRKAGGTDEASNLRGLCREHDNRVKEDAAGVRRNGGRF